MNELSPLHDDGVPAARLPETHAFVPKAAPARSSGGRRTLALAVVALLAGSLGYGFWQHFRVYADVMSTTEDGGTRSRRCERPSSTASPGVRSVSWPATTEAFEQAKSLRSRQRVYFQTDCRHRQPRQGR